MTHASLFSGIGGPEVAAQMLGWDNLFHCEINPFGRRVLEYHFPNSVSYEDIKKTDFSQWRGRVDVLTGGFPCQPFSYAGKRAGAEDDRYLWPEMLRAISECQPTWVVGENVAGITTMVEQESVVEVGAEATLFEDMEALQGRTYEERGRFTIDRVCADLEAIGYAVQPVLIPACAVGAPHRRDRVFIIAYANSMGRSERRSETDGREEYANDPRIFSELERLRSGEPSSNSADNRLEHDTQSGSQREMSGEEQGCDTELHVSVTADGCGRTTADTDNAGNGTSDRQSGRAGQTMDGERENIALDGISGFGASSFVTDTEDNGLQHGMRARRGESESERDYRVGDRWQGFPSVSPVHRGNDGLPFDVHDLTIPFTQWRTESLKAYGNAIVPQVMYEIFRAIEIITKKQ